MFSIVFADAYDILHYERKYEVAKAKAIKEHKPLMLMVASPTCHWCKKLTKKVLSEQSVSKQVFKNFVPVVVMNTQKSSFPTKYATSIVPVVYFINPVKGEELWEAIGYRTKKQFLDDVKEAKFSVGKEL